MTQRTSLLVFTDLDGSLLDHHTYQFEEALPALRRLDEHQIPLILTSSKTASEIERIRSDLGNSDPFIAENGAAAFVPRSITTQQPAGTREKDSYWLYETVQPRAHWLTLIDEIGKAYPGAYRTFFSAGTKGIIEMTGLSEDAAKAANERGYSEPVAWVGDESSKKHFVDQLEAAGAVVQQGGRFLSVSGPCSKGKALKWLREQYLNWWDTKHIEDLAIGDGQNDVPMLAAARSALLIKSPVHAFPSLQTSGTILHSKAVGPAGWQEGVTRWLAQFDPTT